jgi:hypothetical protein
MDHAIGTAVGNTIGNARGNATGNPMDNTTGESIRKVQILEIIFMFAQYAMQ